MSLWVVEANVDIPVQLPGKGDASPTALYVSLGGEDPDGFVQMRPRDVNRAMNAVFWSAEEPISYECRALVRALNAAYALLRGKELYEHVADRLTLLLGYAVRVLDVGFVYNEDELSACIRGERSEYEGTSGGAETFRTAQPKNSSQQLMMPPVSALEAIRWFRHGMTAVRGIDQYLAYYISLESIARHVPGVTRQPRPDSTSNPPELESQESAAIKHLLAQRGITPSGRQTLAMIRARIAHGSTDAATLELASKNLPLLQRLAADGIALVIGLPPDALNILPPRPIEFLAPMSHADYSPTENPAARWGGLLSDEFSKYLSQTRAAQETARVTDRPVG